VAGGHVTTGRRRHRLGTITIFLTSLGVVGYANSNSQERIPKTGRDCPRPFFSRSETKFSSFRPLSNESVQPRTNGGFAGVKRIQSRPPKNVFICARSLARFEASCFYFFLSLFLPGVIVLINFGEAICKINWKTLKLCTFVCTQAKNLNIFI
jgi:hypothetical protein